MDPVLGAEVLEGEEAVELASDLGYRLGMTGQGVNKGLDRGESVGAGRGAVDGGDLGFASGWKRLDRASSTRAVLCTQQRCSRVEGNTSLTS